MKAFKTMTIALGLFLALSFTACQKEKTGVYAPKKKIQQIYYSVNGSEKKPYQNWVWDGDRISSITHYTAFNLKSSTWEEVFTYEDNRIKRVDDLSNGEYITYEYSDDHLRTATVFYHNYIECTWAVGYEGDHITKLTGTFYDMKKCGHERHLNPLSHMFPQEVCDYLTRCEQLTAQQCQKDDNYTISLQFVWEGDDITKIVYSDDEDVYSIQMQYDDKCCPWYGFMGGLEDYLTALEAGSTCFSKHNMTEMVYTEDHYTEKICFAYQYDSDKFPILQTSYPEDNPDEKRVFYYEY